MKYDVYKGTKKDMENSEGQLLYLHLTKTRLFCKFGRELTEKLVAGEFVDFGTSGYWLEEAM